MKGQAGYRSFSHYICMFATGLWPILPLPKHLLINRNCSFWLNETLDIIGWWRKFIKVIFFAMICCNFSFWETNGKIYCKERIFIANFQPQIFIKGMFSHKFAVSMENICQILEGKQTNKQTFLINICCIFTQ